MFNEQHLRSLRQNMTQAEHRMWYYLRNRRLGGYKFIRQHALGDYIVDFICREKNLIIELDGGHHMAAVVYDKKRSSYLEQCGYRILRVWNHEVFENVEGVALKILSLIEEGNPSSPTLLP